MQGGQTMIRTTKSLYLRTVELAKDTVPEPFLNYGHADDLGLGWFPSREAFSDNADPVFWRGLPRFCGAVFPYRHNFQTLSHLTIIPYTEFNQLDRQKRFCLPNRRRTGKTPAGVFGIERLRRKHKVLVVTDDEAAVCKDPDTIAVSNLDATLIRFICRAAHNIEVQGSTAGWTARMFDLARHGTPVSVNGVDMVEHVAGKILEMFHQRASLPILTHRAVEYLNCLLPIQRMAVIGILKQEHNLDLSRTLPDDFHVFRREGDFYDAVGQALRAKLADARFEPPFGIQVTSRDGRRLLVPYERGVLGAVLAELVGARLDLLDWAYDQLQELPHFYLFKEHEQLATRAEVSRKVEEVALAVLSRMAAEADARKPIGRIAQ